MVEDDPAAPGEDGIAPGLTRAEAINLANGVASRLEALVGVADGPLSIDINQAWGFLQDCMTSVPRVRYGLGAKAPNDASQPGAPSPPGFLAIDCSGFVRSAIRRSTTPEAVGFPDGSVVQHGYVAQRFPLGIVDDGDLQDGVVRIAFLPPAAEPSGIGHVVLLYNGVTLESHGGVGPDSRTWSALPWRIKTQVYALT